MICGIEIGLMGTGIMIIARRKIAIITAAIVMITKGCRKMLENIAESDKV